MNLIFNLKFTPISQLLFKCTDLKFQLKHVSFQSWQNKNFINSQLALQRHPVHLISNLTDRQKGRRTDRQKTDTVNVLNVKVRSSQTNLKLKSKTQ